MYYSFITEFSINSFAPVIIASQFRHLHLSVKQLTENSVLIVH